MMEQPQDMTTTVEAAEITVEVICKLCFDMGDDTIWQIPVVELLDGEVKGLVVDPHEHIRKENGE